MKVSEAMTRNVFTVEPATAIGDVAKAMASRDSGVVPVVDEGRVVGIVTDRDLTVRGLSNGLQSGARVFRIMTQDVATCEPDDSLDAILDDMAVQQVRRMPVCTDDGRLVGIVSVGDAARLDSEKEDVGEALGLICRPRGLHCQSAAV